GIAQEYMVDPEIRLRCIEIIKENESLITRNLALKDRIDLHIHTFFSDGRNTPAGVVLEAWIKYL
ncbi:MAG: hypothetical protein ACE5J3_12800, partial [Methanosarcinales archaeon]